MCAILIHDTQAWWNGRHAGLRSQCLRVRVQVPPPAPRYGDSLLAISVSFCRRCFEILVLLSFDKRQNYRFWLNHMLNISAHLPSVKTGVQVPFLLLITHPNKRWKHYIYVLIYKKEVMDVGIRNVKREWSRPLWVHCKKHYCPHCLTRLSTTKISRIVDGQSNGAKRTDFALGNTYMIGDLKIIHTAFLCTHCNQLYSISEIKEHERSKNRLWD